MDQLAERGGARGACSILIIVFYIQSGMILSVFENGRGGVQNIKKNNRNERNGKDKEKENVEDEKDKCRIWLNLSVSSAQLFLRIYLISNKL